MIDVSKAVAISERAFPRGPEAVADYLGIRVRYSPMAGCAGWCVRNQTLAVIRINASTPWTRQRFTLAHELAHLVLGSTPPVVPIAEHFNSQKPEESAADQLAAEFLLPQTRLVGCSLPVVAPKLKEIARVADVSEVMVACRIASLARELGLINAAVLSFQGQNLNWVWSKTLDVSPATGLHLLNSAHASPTKIVRLVDGGQVTVASILPRDDISYLFIQLLPEEIGNTKNTEEIIRELGQWLFESDSSFRAQVNGCLSNFKLKVSGLDVEFALSQFNATYLNRWTGKSGDRIRHPNGQQFLRLRLAAWCQK